MPPDADLLAALIDAGIPGIVAIAIVWAAVWRKREGIGDGLAEKFDDMRIAVTERLARLEAQVETLMRDRK